MIENKHIEILRYLRIILALTWAIFIFMLLSAPMPISTVYVFTWYDKLIHSFLFGVMAYFTLVALYYGFNSTLSRSIKFTSAFCFIFIITMEYLQNFFPGRTPDIVDSIAGFAGVLLCFLYFYANPPKLKHRLLLHICCVGCGLHIIKKLSKEFIVDLYFYNPNIFPKVEYDMRLKDARRISKEVGVKLFEGGYDHNRWRKIARGLENEAEGKDRCVKCYKYRLECTAQFGKENGYPYFATTLSISPYKNTESINQVGNQAGKIQKIIFLGKDFKSGGGFEKNLVLSKIHSVYRQKYCGCEFSETYKPAKKHKI
jgi:epoxyqueuosine reductase